MSNYSRLPQLSKTLLKKTDEKLPFISVIIPTRNETTHIQKCLTSLKTQSYPHLEILIIDDSTDDTIQIMNKIIDGDSRFIIHKQEPLPGGWVGKPHALQQANRYAKGEWLLFIDADTFHGPELIEKAVDYIRKNNIDLLSLVPHHICLTFWEKVIQPIPLALIPAISPLAKVNKADSKVVVAFGPFMLLRRSVFDKIGGYETIKGRIADDAEMAQLVKNSGYAVGLANAQDLIQIRMYEKFHDIWEGWSKNIFLGLVQKRGIRSTALRMLVALVGAFGIFSLMVFPFFAMVTTFILMLLTHSSQWQLLFFCAIVLWIITFFMQFCIQKYYRIGDPKYAVLSFLGGIITIGIFLNSAIKSLSRSGVAWKGRIYTE